MHPTPNTRPIAPTTLGRQILATLRTTRRRYRPYDLALELGLAGDNGWPLFQAALDTIPKSQIIRVRGSGAYLQAA